MTRLPFSFVLLLSGCGQAFSFATGAVDASAPATDATTDAFADGPGPDSSPPWCRTQVGPESDAGARIRCVAGGSLQFVLNNGATVEYGNTYPATPVGGFSNAALVFVRNPTPQDLLPTDILRVDVFGDFDAFQMDSNRCEEGGIGSGGCHLGVHFAPRQAGAHQGMVEIELATLGLSTFCFHGEGYDRLLVNPRGVCFPTPQAVGSESVPVELLIRNVESVDSLPLHVSVVGDAFRIVSPREGGCEDTMVPAAGSCRLQVFFRAMQSGGVSGALLVDSEGFAPPITVVLQASGL